MEAIASARRRRSGARRLRRLSRNGRRESRTEPALECDCAPLCRCPRSRRASIVRSAGSRGGRPAPTGLVCKHPQQPDPSGNDLYREWVQASHRHGSAHRTGMRRAQHRRPNRGREIPRCRCLDRKRCCRIGVRVSRGARRARVRQTRRRTRNRRPTTKRGRERPASRCSRRPHGSDRPRRRRDGRKSPKSASTRQSRHSFGLRCARSGHREVRASLRPLAIQGIEDPSHHKGLKDGITPRLRPSLRAARSERLLRHPTRGCDPLAESRRRGSRLPGAPQPSAQSRDASAARRARHRIHRA